MILGLKAGLTASAVTVRMNDVSTINGSNFKLRTDDAVDVLGCIDLDMALEEDKIPKPIDGILAQDMTRYEANQDKWEWFNNMYFNGEEPLRNEGGHMGSDGPLMKDWFSKKPGYNGSV